jgi:16S rRNA C967 or C1407 C5-methylase (RsmB/RsmF family)
MLQTLKPKRIVANDISSSRLQRIKYVLDMYVNNFKDIRDIVQTSKNDGMELPLMHSDGFDKVLCDVPCFTDRHVIREDESSIFQAHRKRERILLPETQIDLLA